jgi:hypothetical protein
MAFRIYDHTAAFLGNKGAYLDDGLESVLQPLGEARRAGQGCEKTEDQRKATSLHSRAPLPLYQIMAEQTSDHLSW